MERSRRLQEECQAIKLAYLNKKLKESYTPEWSIWVKNANGEWKPWGARSEFPSSEELAELKDWLFDRGYKDIAVLKNNGSRPVVGMYEDFEDEHVGDKEVGSTPNVPDTPEGFGVATLINNLIQDEWQAIQGYNDAIATLSITDVDENIINVFRDIANEENVHVGQLQKALELVSPNVASITKGEEEAGKQLEEPPTE